MALFVLSLCVFDISLGVGAFVIALSQSSSFLSLKQNMLVTIFNPYIWIIMLSQSVLLIQRQSYIVLHFIEKEPSCSFDAAVYNAGTLPRCATDSRRIFASIMLGFYMLLSNILLLNVLIAMFRYIMILYWHERDCMFYARRTAYYNGYHYIFLIFHYSTIYVCVPHFMTSPLWLAVGTQSL